MAVVKKVVFVCSDGTEFGDQQEADKHEYTLKSSQVTRAQNWLRTSYNGKELTKKYSLAEFGVWRIRGEDPNCDLGGHHYEPDLGTVVGKLEEVVQYAVSLDSFFTWGGGGRIIKLDIKNITKE
jgi:hypothetical protein